VAHTKRPATFAQIVEDLPVLSVLDGAPGHPVRPGRHNKAGDWFAPDGVLLTQVEDDIDSDRAAELMRSGALVAWENCGCGGYYRGCEPMWLNDAQLRGLRDANPLTFSGDGWAEVWTGGSTTVVLILGGAHWGGSIR